MGRTFLRKGIVSLFLSIGILTMVAVLAVWQLGEATAQTPPNETNVAAPVAPQADLMAVDWQQIIRLLGRSSTTDEQMIELIPMTLGTLYTSSLTPLPGAGVKAEDSRAAFGMYEQMALQARAALKTVKEGGRSAQVRAMAHQAHDLVGMTLEADQNVALRTMELDPHKMAQELGLCDPAGGHDPTTEECLPASFDDDGDACPGGVCGREPSALDLVNPHLLPYFRWEVRSPWPIFFWPPIRQPEHDSFELEAIAPGECAVIVKEWDGIKRVVRPRFIGHWIEPWTSRARFVGYWVWVAEWLPAEFLKELSYCNVDGKIQSEVRLKIVPMRHLREFWSFFRKDP